MAKKVTRAKKEIPKDEPKSARFIRVVTPRVNKAVKSISVLGFCAGSTYEYTPAQVKQIIGTLLKAVADVESRFQLKVGGEGSFTFSE